MPYTLAEAAKATGTNKTTILRAIKSEGPPSICDREPHLPLIPSPRVFFHNREFQNPAAAGKGGATIRVLSAPWFSKLGYPHEGWARRAWKLIRPLLAARTVPHGSGITGAPRRGPSLASSPTPAHRHRPRHRGPGGSDWPVETVF